jgi:hypothetical protein
MWDIEVDLVSVGAGVGGLAGAIATADSGGTVLIADATRCGAQTSAVATRRRVHSTRGWLQDDVKDTKTDEFFASLAEGLPGSAYVARDTPVPTRSATTTPHDGNAVEPFLGSRLMDWAGQCLTSPYGMLYSSVFGWDATSMRSTDGGTIQVVPIGAIDWRRGLGGQVLQDWMRDRVREREIETLTDTGMERLVFEGGRVTGVVLSTSNGSLAVRARRGVTIAPREHDAATAAIAPVGGEQRQVCLVGQTASRFGRVELLSSAVSGVGVRSMCPGPIGARAFHTGLHEARQASSGLGRYGKVHWHPTVGQ